MRLTKRNKSRKVPMGAGLAMALGGALLSWGYRSWSRHKAKTASQGGTDTQADTSADIRTDIRSDTRTDTRTDTHADSRSEPVEVPEAERLAERYHGLDEEVKAGRFPRDLERDHKNIEQSIHPT